MNGDQDRDLGAAHRETLLSEGPSKGEDLALRPTAVHPERSADIAEADEAAGRTMPSGAPVSRDVESGRILGGKVELVRLLGKGGMGMVWKGVHLGLGIPVAVKIMHPEVAGATDFVRRFRREAHAASLIDHPNVVRILDFGEDAGTLYMVMEYLDGRSLTDWLRRYDASHECPPLADVVAIFHMLLDAFVVAHEYGIVHRDLKPDNVLLAELAGKLTLKVVDFGLAHVDDARDKGPTLTSGDVIAGTPEYMSPEQCRSLAVGPSADIYSMGCLLTEMLQLKPPFTGGSAIEILAKQMFANPAPLARPPLAEPVPPLLERLRLDLLSKTPEKRPKSAADVKARLDEAMSAEATLARLPTRKGDEPLGDRASRAPRWDTRTNTVPPDSAPQTTRTRARAIGVLRLSHDEAGVGGECQTGLATRKLDVVAVQSASDAAVQSLGVVVVDAGSSIDEATASLAQLRAAFPKCRVLVCSDDLTTEGMNALVAAGAADVVRYPVTADTLGRKIERVLRRGR